MMDFLLERFKNTQIEIEEQQLNNIIILTPNGKMTLYDYLVYQILQVMKEVKKYE